MMCPLELSSEQPVEEPILQAAQACPHPKEHGLERHRQVLPVSLPTCFPLKGQEGVECLSCLRREAAFAVDSRVCNVQFLRYIFSLDVSAKVLPLEPK